MPFREPNFHEDCYNSRKQRKIKPLKKMFALYAVQYKTGPQELPTKRIYYHLFYYSGCDFRWCKFSYERPIYVFVQLRIVTLNLLR